ncbi:uncharacterized protein BXZ73DRAFT_91555 [Epithele typhae]|uniref:uncharacterized protein n=1 Tax=Epithele typhae TaxID=378194 RepID=UPI00200862A1|nr:uncharacterized protein BXZ73DRAFT_91555 [Epithele typhae]KAH9922843.1 hypothetical protein BXZ73DRAFT_91555 [Epithele typhae]
MRVEEGFQPVPFVEGNPYTTDPILPSLLERILPAGAFEEVHDDLSRFGGEVLTTLRELCKRSAPPELVQYDSWGRRVDELRTSEGWRALKEVYHREGAVAIPYERRYGAHSRVYGFAKLLLANADSEMVDCPMSMTDGVARVIELQGSSELKRDILTRLVSRDPAQAFTAGQWMTERPGGSDVSRTETTATPSPSPIPSLYGPEYTLDGFKWFSSATDSDVALALARTGPTSAGARALSLFLLGTRALPTAELELAGTRAFLLGQAGDGVRAIAPVLGITRVHSAATSAAHLRKAYAAARAHAEGRVVARGALLRDAPLHVAQLARVGVLYRAVVHLVLGAAGLLGRVECGTASEEEGLRLRMVTPAVKAFEAEMCPGAVQECMACLGGQGYMEESGFATLIQDGLVERIWEGTTTVLSLDLLRTVEKGGALRAFASWAQVTLDSCPGALAEQLGGPLSLLRSAQLSLQDAYVAPVHPLMPRPALFLVAFVTSSLLMLEHVIWATTTARPEASTEVEVFRRWVLEGGLTSAAEEVARTKSLPRGRTEADGEISESHCGGGESKAE